MRPNVRKCKLIFPTDTLQQKIEITDLKAFYAAENTIVLIVLATTVYVSVAVGISLRLQGKLGFPYNVKKFMVKYVLLC